MLLPPTTFAGAGGYIHKEAIALVRESRNDNDRCSNYRKDTISPRRNTRPDDLRKPRSLAGNTSVRSNAQTAIRSALKVPMPANNESRAARQRRNHALDVADHAIGHAQPCSWIRRADRGSHRRARQPTCIAISSELASPRSPSTTKRRTCVTCGNVADTPISASDWGDRSGTGVGRQANPDATRAPSGRHSPVEMS